MKRVVRSKKCRLLAVLITLVLLTACASPLSGTPTADAYIQAKKAYQEDFVPKQDIPMAEITNIPPGYENYAQQICRYYLPLAENWTRDTCIEYELSDVMPDRAGLNGLQNIGFVCVDMNADGVDELLIGSLAPEDPAILELWAIVNDKPKLIAQAEGQSRYYLRYNESTNQYIWENCIGASGSDLAYFYFVFNGSYMEYLWDIFPGISTASQDARREAAAQTGGKRVLPAWIPYAALDPA